MTGCENLAALPLHGSGNPEAGEHGPNLWSFHIYEFGLCAIDIRGPASCQAQRFIKRGWALHAMTARVLVGGETENSRAMN